MAEPFDPNSLSAVRNSPRDLQLMDNILKEMGITNYEPGVLNEMLEFNHRYLTTILDDAYLYSFQAKKKCVDSEDIKLAISLYKERKLCTPSRAAFLKYAKQRNSLPLPQIKSSAGLRLSPGRHSLTSCNYRFKTYKKRVHTVTRISASSISSNLNNKNNALINVNKQSIPALPKSCTSLSPAITKPVSSISKPMPASIIKFSDGKVASSSLSQSPTPISVPATVNSVSQILLPTVGTTSVTTAQILMPTMGVTTAASNQLLMPSIGITSAPQILMPTVGITSTTTTQINMPTVGTKNTDIKLPTEASINKRDLEEDDDYDME